MGVMGALRSEDLVNFKINKMKEIKLWAIKLLETTKKCFLENDILLNLYLVKRKQNIEQRLFLAVNPAWRTWFNSLIK